MTRAAIRRVATVRRGRAVYITVVASLAALALASPGTRAAAPGSITEFSTGLNTGANLYGVAPGSDGAVWLTDHGSTAAIGRVTASGHSSESSNGLPGGSAPYAMTAGPDGNIWFLDENSTPFGRATPGGQVSEFGKGLPTNSDPDWFTTGTDGRLWFTDTSSRTVGWLTPCSPLPCTPAIHELTSTLPSTTDLGAIATGSDGEKWFIDNRSPNYYIGRVTPSGQFDEFLVGSGLSAAIHAITLGPDGNLWFTQPFAPAIGRVTPCQPLPCTPAIQEFPGGLGAGSQPGYGIAAGPDGNVWFTDSGTTHAIGKVIPCRPAPSCTPGITEFSSGLSQGSQLWSIAPGSDGNMWFAESGAIGRVGTGASAASVTPPAVTGSLRSGEPQLCDSIAWSTWAGEQPSTSASAADGYQWLLDGSPLPGQTKQIYAPTTAQVAHQLSCLVTVTYPVPLFVTASATSAQVTVLAPAPPSTKITKAKVSSRRHTAKVSFAALGPASGFQCALVKKPARHHRKPHPQFAGCASPKTYRQLKSGTYTFEVRALGLAGGGPGPAAIKRLSLG